MDKDKKVFIELIVVLVLVGFGLWLITRSSTSTTPASTQTALTPTEDITAGSVDVGAPAATIAYADALIKYKNARIQLDANCQANPESQSMTFKNNALLMVDNRAPVARTVHIGSIFTVNAASFKIIKLSSATLPATWLVDCDKSQNVATIKIEK